VPSAAARIRFRGGRAPVRPGKRQVEAEPSEFALRLFVAVLGCEKIALGFALLRG